MGRETKFLLSLLGLLAGVFLGVVTVKLFVPRPPAGAGPDVHAAVAAEPQNLVEPPELAPPPAPPLDSDDTDRGATGRFAADASAEAMSDPFLARASFAAAADATPSDDPSATSADLPAAAEVVEPPSPPSSPIDLTATAVGLPETTLMPLPPPAQPSATGAVHVVQPGDSWWAIAERAYGDGRFYRALYAWNRSLDPRVSLAAGTRLQVPPAAALAAAWPALLPGP